VKRNGLVRVANVTGSANFGFIGLGVRHKKNEDLSNIHIKYLDLIGLTTIEFQEWRISAVGV
jgi:hypothetical protein